MDSHPWFLVWFIPIILWSSCSTNTLVPNLALSVILSALSLIVYSYYKQIQCYTICQQFIHLFQVGLLCLISLQYQLSFADFSVGLHEVIQIYISHSFGTKSQCCWREMYTRWMSGGCLYHQCNQSIHVTDGMTVASLSLDNVSQMALHQKLSHIIYAKQT